MNEFFTSLEAAQEALSAKKISALELTREALRRAKQTKKELNAYTHIEEPKALALAEQADKVRAQGGVDVLENPLLGIPFALKDNVNWQGCETTAGSKILRGYIATYSATLLNRLLKRGMVVFGKTNLDEFAMGSSNENSSFGLVRNPWNKECVPGGSSGGSAAVVSAANCLMSIGTDTGGSIRQPASFCNLTGLKPTYGTVSRFGIVAFASSLDQAGPMTRDVLTTAATFEAMAGHDVYDATTASQPIPKYYSQLIKHRADFRKNGQKTNKKRVIGIPKEYFLKGLDSEVAKKIDEAKAQLEKLGHQFVEISLPHTSYAVATYYVCATSEASSNLARYDGVRFGYRTPEYRDNLELYEKTRAEGFGPEVKRRILLGTFALSSGYYDAYYRKAGQVRTKFAQDFAQAFQTVDAILTPTAPKPAFAIGSKNKDPLALYLEDIYTIGANLVGIPALSIPAGLTSNKMPVGLQLMGNFFDESTLFELGLEFQEVTSHHQHLSPYAQQWA